MNAFGVEMYRTALLSILFVVACWSQLPAGQQATETPSAEQHTDDTRPAPDARRPKQHSLQKIAANHLPNPVRLHAKVISGGLPEGEAGFRELQQLGVKTIINVDGAKPDVATAKRFGLRYVHLPHGYDGVPGQRVKELAKAVRELDGPIYIHCHHGKHRSPAAASVACVAAGLLPESDSVAVLKFAGTSPNYRGLYESARLAKRLDEASLDELKVEFHETVDVPPMAEAMVNIGHTHDHLKEIAAAGWRGPKQHPDLEPAHEALLLREHFTELLRTDEARQAPDTFQRMLEDSSESARRLEVALRGWRPDTPSAKPPALLNRLSARISANCKACHLSFRDVPLSEK